MKFIIGYLFLSVISLIFTASILKTAAQADEQSERMYQEHIIRSDKDVY